MRIRWRGLELPGRVVRDDDVSTESFGRFVVEPFEQGYGTTIGNSLRRVLLSSLQGAAVTSVKIAGVGHEFASIDGVYEDVTDIILNVKGLVVSYDGEEPKTLTLQRDKAGEVRAKEITGDASVSIVNPDHLLATLTDDVPFEMELTVRRGRGYATAADNTSAEQEIGVIPVDSVFSPVRRVRYRTEAMRVGQLTNYDRLILEVWTNGTVKPEDTLVEAGLILRKHLSPFVMYHERGTVLVPRAHTPSAETRTAADTALEELLNRPVAMLNLSVRACNCLEAARVETVRDLVSRTVADLLRVRSFGKTTLEEVQAKLAELGLSLGMRFGDEAGGESSGASAGGSTPSIEPPTVGGPPMPPSLPSSSEESEASGETDEAEGNQSTDPKSGTIEAYTMPE